MKKLSIILVTISILCFVITTSALATNVTLCVAGNTLNLAVQSKGNNGGATIFGVNGWLQSGKNIVVDGTLIKSGSELVWGLQLENAMAGYAAVVWEFITDMGFYGSGEFQWQTNGEVYGYLAISPGPCSASASASADKNAVGLLE